ncbi:MAG: hypothetical protein AAF216_09295 [Pseudomonadota bacterium]
MLRPDGEPVAKQLSGSHLYVQGAAAERGARYISGSVTDLAELQSAF